MSAHVIPFPQTLRRPPVGTPDMQEEWAQAQRINAITEQLIASKGLVSWAAEICRNPGRVIAKLGGATLGRCPTEIPSRLGSPVSRARSSRSILGRNPKASLSR
jgi:hypothetical protein